MIQLYEQEGFEAFMDLPYLYAALAYNAVGDSRMAMTYAELALQILHANDLGNGTNRAVLEGLAQNPEGHWSWRKGKP